MRYHNHPNERPPHLSVLSDHSSPAAFFALEADLLHCHAFSTNKAAGLILDCSTTAYAIIRGINTRHSDRGKAGSSKLARQGAGVFAERLKLPTC